MAYQDGHSMAVEDADGTSGSYVDFADLGIAITRGGSWPMLPAPVSSTVNIPGMVGGYTYQNYPAPEDITISLVLEAATLDAAIAAINSFGNAMPVMEEKRIWIDGITSQYWIGRRINGVMGIPIGGRAFAWDLVVRLDDPRPCNASNGNRIG